MVDPQDVLNQAQDNSDTNSRETESLFSLSPKSVSSLNKKVDLDGQDLKQEIEIAELKTQLLLNQSDNKLLRQRIHA